MEETIQRNVKETVQNLLAAMGVNASISEERIENMGDGQEIFTINLETDDPNLLIGQYGANLQCIQHLTGVIVKRNMLSKKEETELTEDEIKFNIDVNSYKKQKKESLVKLAETIANQVIFSKNSVALRPMSSYERKIVHMEIASRKNLTTESVGENLTRRIIIKYVENKNE